MKILVTGFTPFGGEKKNPSWESVRQLPDSTNGVTLVKKEIPTAFTKCKEVLEDILEEEKPDVALHIGQAGGRTNITVEKVAINLAEARIPDNDGEQPMDEPLREDGDTAYFTTLPIKAMVENIRTKYPASVSYTAGTYVCNALMYHALYLAQKKYPNMRAGFIHIPFMEEQVIDKANQPSMSLSSIQDAIQLAIEAILQNEEDIQKNMGTTH